MWTCLIDLQPQTGDSGAGISREAHIDKVEEGISLAQTVQHTNDNIKRKFQEPGCQKTLRSTMLATQTHTISCLS